MYDYNTALFVGIEFIERLHRNAIYLMDIAMGRTSSDTISDGMPDGQNVKSIPPMTIPGVNIITLKSKRHLEQLLYSNRIERESGIKSAEDYTEETNGTKPPSESDVSRKDEKKE
jgi:hypothetical protein